MKTASSSKWLYPILLAVETAGAAVIYSNGLPLYRQLIADPSSFEMREPTAGWATAGIVLIQAGFWLAYYLRPPLPELKNALAGQIVSFVARLVFTLATAIFSFVFISKKLGDIPAWRLLLTLAVLFSLFLFMQELQRLGKSMQKPAR